MLFCSFWGGHFRLATPFPFCAELTPYAVCGPNEVVEWRRMEFQWKAVVHCCRSSKLYIHSLQAWRLRV